MRERCKKWWLAYPTLHTTRRADARSQKTVVASAALGRPCDTSPLKFCGNCSLFWGARAKTVAPHVSGVLWRAVWALVRNCVYCMWRLQSRSRGSAEWVAQNAPASDSGSGKINVDREGHRPTGRHPPPPPESMLERPTRAPFFKNRHLFFPAGSAPTCCKAQL